MIVVLRRSCPGALRKAGSVCRVGRQGAVRRVASRRKAEGGKDAGLAEDVRGDGSIDQHRRAQPDFDIMRPAGVTNHYSRIYTPNADAVSNETRCCSDSKSFPLLTLVIQYVTERQLPLDFMHC